MHRLRGFGFHKRVLFTAFIGLLVPLFGAGLWLALRPFPVQAATNCDTQTDIPPAECEALVTFYTATNGANWSDNTGWNETDSPCSWDGITCEAGQVQAIELNSNRLSGPIPPELSNLTNLEELNLFSNQLSGPIPLELTTLTNLEELILFENQLTGPIPPELSNLTNLRQLYLLRNRLTGTIPPELSTLTNLTDLGLSSNELSGIVPTELSNLTNLRLLFLSNLDLSGSLPASFTNLTMVEQFFFSNTELCEPPDQAFQDWLAGIENVQRTDVICDGTPLPTPTNTTPIMGTPAPTDTPIDMATPTSTMMVTPDPDATSMPTPDPDMTAMPTTMPITPTMTITPTMPTTPTVPITVAQLSINATAGAPGSFFTIIGSDFPGEVTGTVTVNDAPIGTVAISSTGGFTLTLETGEEALPGRYKVTITAGEMMVQQASNVSASIFYRLDDSAPQLPRETDGPLLTVPADAQPTQDQAIYVPIIRQ